MMDIEDIKYDVYISHRCCDTSMARRICSYLHKEGLTVFCSGDDEEDNVGDGTAATIRFDIMVVLISERAIRDKELPENDIWWYDNTTNYDPLLFDWNEVITKEKGLFTIIDSKYTRKFYSERSTLPDIIIPAISSTLSIKTIVDRIVSMNHVQAFIGHENALRSLCSKIVSFLADRRSQKNMLNHEQSTFRKKPIEALLPDQFTGDLDKLGYSAYAEGIVKLLSSTETPFCCGIYARWGAGKSFLINKIAHHFELRNAEEGELYLQRQEQQHGIIHIWFCKCFGAISYLITFASRCCFSSYSTITIVGLLIDMLAELARMISELSSALMHSFFPRKEDEYNSLPVEAPVPIVYTREYLFVNYNAWEFNRTDELWTVIIRNIYQVVEKRLEKISVAGANVDYKRRWRVQKAKKLMTAKYGQSRLRIMLIVFILCCGLLAAAAVSAVVYRKWFMSFVANSTKSISKTASLATACAGAGIVFASVIRYMTTSIHELLSAASNSADSNRGEFLFKNADNVKDQTGLMHDLRTELHELFEFITDDEFKRSSGKEFILTLFIDDLDRCLGEGRIVKVLEAVQLILNVPGDPMMVFIAVDSRVVTSAIESTMNKSMILADTQVTGAEYLSKIVQLSFCIPDPTPESMLRLVEDSARGKAVSPDDVFVLLRTISATVDAKAVSDSAFINHRVCFRDDGCSDRFQMTYTKFQLWLQALTVGVPYSSILKIKILACILTASTRLELSREAHFDGKEFAVRLSNAVKYALSPFRLVKEQAGITKKLSHHGSNTARVPDLPMEQLVDAIRRHVCTSETVVASWNPTLRQANLLATVEALEQQNTVLSNVESSTREAVRIVSNVSSSLSDALSAALKLISTISVARRVTQAAMKSTLDCATTTALVTAGLVSGEVDSLQSTSQVLMSAMDEVVHPQKEFIHAACKCCKLTAAEEPLVLLSEGVSELRNTVLKLFPEEMVSSALRKNRELVKKSLLDAATQLNKLTKALTAFSVSSTTASSHFESAMGLLGTACQDLTEAIGSKFKSAAVPEACDRAVIMVAKVTRIFHDMAQSITSATGISKLVAHGGHYSSHSASVVSSILDSDGAGSIQLVDSINELRKALELLDVVLICEFPANVISNLRKCTLDVTSPAISSAVTNIISSLTNRIDPNPRRVKRILNTVQLVVEIAKVNPISETNFLELAYDSRWPVFLVKLSVWIVLCDCYPFRMSFLVQILLEMNEKKHFNRQYGSAEVKFASIDSIDYESMSIGTFYFEYIDSLLRCHPEYKKMNMLDCNPEFISFLLFYKYGHDELTCADILGPLVEAHTETEAESTNETYKFDTSNLQITRDTNFSFLSHSYNFNSALRSHISSQMVSHASPFAIRLSKGDSTPSSPTTIPHLPLQSLSQPLAQVNSQHRHYPLINSSNLPSQLPYH